MISAGDFRNGLTIELENNVYQVIEFQHVKPGKGAAFVRTKLRNIKNGGVIEKTFRPTEKCPQAHIERPNGYRTWYFIINIEINPFIGPHIPVGKDRISIELSYPGLQEILTFEHVKDYPLPERYQHLYLHWMLNIDAESLWL